MARITRGISLEEWEEKTQLGENELQSIYELQEACAELPLPAGWSADKLSASPALVRSSSSGVRTPDSSSSATALLTPLNAGALSNRLTQLTKRPRSSTNLLAEANAADSAAEKRSILDIKSDKPIETLQHFFDWFAVMESEMEKDQEDVYRNYLMLASLYRKSCDEFLEDLLATCGLLDDLRGEYGFVEKQTRSLQSACEALLDEQEKLTTLADGLSERLAYFNHLEPIAKLFNAPGDDICQHPEFISMLQQLDECIEYMQQHLKYRDAELYLMRFRQCLTRGMTLIKMHIVNAIRSLGYDVYKQITNKGADPSSQNKQTTLFYVRFRMIASEIKTLSTQLEQRCLGYKEYQSLYQEALNAYFQTRQNLLGPVISRKIQQLGPTGGDLLAFARNGCAYMMNLCLDEFNLFNNFFSQGEDELYAYLDLLTSYLYDHLRPRIIHENNISTLSELCNIFQVYVLRDEHALDAGDDGSKQPTLAFGHLIQNVLEDAQGRLVFRAQMYIESAIQKYQPRPEDFELRPATAEEQKTSVVLEGSAARHDDTQDGPATLAIEQDESDGDKPVSDSPLREGTDVSRGWFPTLQKTLWLLSKLYQCVQTGVFEDLAQEAVSFCEDSLKQAYETVMSTKSRLDGQLFLIRHLLVLKEQLAPFEANLVHSGKTLDFSHVTDTLSSFQQDRSLIFNPNALINLAQYGMPRVVEISLDSRREIDRELKQVCEDFIMDCVRGAIEPLSHFMVKTSTIRPAHIETRLESAMAQDVKHASDQFKEAAAERIRFVVRKLREYVNDYKIEQILMKPIQANIIEEYRAFYQRAEASVKGDDLPMSVEATAVWIAQLKDEP
ncbi:Sec34-like family-domain-containing protein [Syncephalastrum racemosum]|uniref:Conserved oligomeric Golgi complex subunit 3 n=1 Tax=Syncephalastrum racemosum TaxID=13706 RepID=A0A1X2HT36_SYNRA|nr:Sec34-like family-domain-containing protein [Syncephalastrum racemosum]